MDINFILPESSPGEARKPSVFAAACLFVSAGVGQILAPYIAIFIGMLFGLRASNGADANAINAMAQILYYLLFIVLPVGAYCRLRPTCLDAMRVNPISTSSAILCALAAVAGTFFALYASYLWILLIEALGGTIPDSGARVPETASGLCAAVLMSAVLPGICEELLFRGAMLGAWEEKGSIKAMIIVSLWFTALHGSVEGIPTQMLVGLVLCFVVISTNSLFAGMIYHTVHNAACLILAYAGSSSALTPEEMQKSTYELIGGAVGVASILMNILVFGLLLFFLLRRIDRARLREKRFDFGVSPYAPTREKGWSELVVLCAGAIIAGMLYLENLFQIAGYIA